MNGIQASGKTKAENSKKARGTPTYRDPAKLRAAYELEGGDLSAVAEHFEGVHYTTVRKWLIEYGIHVPNESGLSRAKQLEEANPDEYPKTGGVRP